MLNQRRLVLSGISIAIAIAAILANMVMLGGVHVFQSLDHAQGFIWSSLPYLVLILISLMASRTTPSAAIALSGTVFTAWVGLDSLYHGFYRNSDPQAALVVIVLPMMQWLLCGFTVAAIVFMVFVKWLVVPKQQ